MIQKQEINNDVMERPDSVDSLDQAKKIVTALTFDHIYAKSTDRKSYFGCYTFNELIDIEMKLNQISELGYTVYGITFHCGSGILIDGVKKLTKVLNIRFNAPDGQYPYGLFMGGNLDYIIGLTEIGEDYSEFSDIELQDLTSIIENIFGVKMIRRTKDSLIWLSDAVIGKY